MIEGEYIEGSKMDFSVINCLPQSGYPSGNFPDSSCLKPKR